MENSKLNKAKLCRTETRNGENRPTEPIPKQRGTFAA
jgi:hypothetical protein